MKHIFMVENHITFYIALSIQRYLNLKPEDIVFVTTEGYKNHIIEQKNVADLTKSAFFFIGMVQVRESLLNLGYIVPNLRKIFYGYSQMKKIVRERAIPIHTDYVLYTEHLHTDFRIFLGSAPHCKKCVLVEEGTLSYVKKNWNERKIRRRYLEGGIRRFFKPLLIKMGHFFRNTFKISSIPYGERIQGYTLSKDGFPNSRLIAKIVIPFYEEKQLNFKKIPDHASIFFMEWTIDLGYFKDPKIFWDRLKVVLALIEAKEVYVKFHLGNKPATRERVIEILKAIGKTPEIIPDVIPTEQIFVQKKKVTVYGMRTSCLWYAGLLKVKNIFAFEEFFMDVYKEQCLLPDEIRALLERYAHFIKPLTLPVDVAKRA